MSTTTPTNSTANQDITTATENIDPDKFEANGYMLTRAVKTANGFRASPVSTLKLGTIDESIDSIQASSLASCISCAGKKSKVMSSITHPNALIVGQPGVAGCVTIVRQDKDQPYPGEVRGWVTSVFPKNTPDQIENRETAPDGLRAALLLNWADMVKKVIDSVH